MSLFTRPRGVVGAVRGQVWERRAQNPGSPRRPRPPGLGHREAVVRPCASQVSRAHGTARGCGATCPPACGVLVGVGEQGVGSLQTSGRRRRPSSPAGPEPRGLTRVDCGGLVLCGTPEGVEPCVASADSGGLCSCSWAGGPRVPQQTRPAWPPSTVSLSAGGPQRAVHCPLSRRDTPRPTQAPARPATVCSCTGLHGQHEVSWPPGACPSLSGQPVLNWSLWPPLQGTWPGACCAHSIHGLSSSSTHTGRGRAEAPAWPAQPWALLALVLTVLVVNSGGLSFTSVTVIMAVAVLESP